MLQRILVALDGSPLAEQVIPFAAELAKTFDSEIILLRVVEANHHQTGRSLDSFDWRLGRAEAIDYLTDIKEELARASIPVDIDVTSGRASDEILEIAAARDVDLIVLGSHGAGGVSQFHMASTAQKVASTAETSILVVPVRETSGAGGETTFTSVIVPVDGSSHSDWAVSVAARLARVHEVELIMLHVVRRPALIDPQGTARETELVGELVELNRRAATRYLTNLQRRLECPGLAVRSTVEVADDVAPVIVRLARSELRPLVVLSSRCASCYDEGPRGGLVTVLLSEADHPVLVLREAPRNARPSPRWRDVATAKDRGWIARVT